MSHPTYAVPYTGDQVKDALGKILGLNTFEFTTKTTETINNTTFQVFWKIAPATSNEVVGFAIHPDSGQLYEVASAAGYSTATSVKPLGTASATVEGDTLIFG
jgi:hypothetical protein